MVWQIVLWVWRLLDGAKWFADCICTVLLIVLRFICLRCKPAIMLVNECVCHCWNVCRNGGICSVVCRFVYRLFWLVLSRRKGIFCVQRFWLRLKPCRIRFAGGFSTFFVTYACFGDWAFRLPLMRLDWCGRESTQAQSLNQTSIPNSFSGCLFVVERQPENQQNEFCWKQSNV